jgi:hypothetical protein
MLSCAYNLLVLCFAFASPGCPFVSVCASSQRMGKVAVVAKNLDMYIYIYIYIYIYERDSAMIKSVQHFLKICFAIYRMLDLSHYQVMWLSRMRAWSCLFCVSLHALRSQMEVSTSCAG